MIERQTETSSMPTTDDRSGATLTEAALRALAEAEERRLARRRADQGRPREINGRKGPEPVRYGDWENKGIASDF